MNKKTLKGTATFSGIAIGKVLYYHRTEFKMRQYLNSLEHELMDFRNARNVVKEEIREDWRHENPSEEKMENYRMQIELLDSGSFVRAVESMITNEGVNASHAVSVTRQELINTFAGLENPEIRKRIENISEICKRLVRLLGEMVQKIDLGEEPVILMAESLSPTEIMEMDKSKILAVVTHQGSVDSHSSIVAKTMEVPALVEIDVDEKWDGCMAIVDGYTGMICLNPGKELLKEYEKQRQADIQEKEALLQLREEKDITLDGKQVVLHANIGNLEDLAKVLSYGASGVGLLRSEFQYLGREDYPRETELFRVYKKVAETMGDRPVVIRTVDVGADKKTDYMEIPLEDNPIMGNRGIRLCLDRRRMFKAQLRAIYKASVYGNISLMFPMITSEEELDEIEKILDEVKNGLKQKNILYKDIQIGILIETPAAVMISEELAKRVDFLSIGTNDLTQYALAMDRENPSLKEKYNDHHPAVLRMIRMVVEAAHAQNRKVSLCGEIAADTELTKTFLKMGVDSLSVVPARILPVRKAIREINLRE